MMFIGGGVGGIGRTGGIGRAGGAAGGGSFAFPVDTTALSDMTFTWWSDVVRRSASELVIGYSKSDGRFGIAEVNPATGALIDARIVLDEPSLYVTMDDHFAVVSAQFQAGPHVGKMVMWTLPHGGAAAPGAGEQRYYQRYSNSGRIADLVPSGAPGADFVDPGRKHNLGHIIHRADGRICLFTQDDGRQETRIFRCDDPAVLAVPCRPLIEMTGAPGLTDSTFAQLYSIVVPGPGPDTVRGISVLHPSVPGAPIKTWLVDLAAEQVRLGSDPATGAGGVVQGAGSIFATGGAALLTYGAAPAINSPAGDTFTRVHDLCQYGAYRYGRAVALTQGLYAGDINAGSHIVRWCGATADPEVAANWQQVVVGAANRAQSWDNGTNRRYNLDIQFLPVEGAETMRVLVIAFDGTNRYRSEIWATSTTPDDLAFFGATEWVTSPRPMRAAVNPGAATDPIKAVIISFVGPYNTFMDFTPGPVQFLDLTPAAPSIVSVPVVTGAPQTGLAYGASTDAVFSGNPPPDITRQMQIGTDDEDNSPEAGSDVGTSTYAAATGDIGKYLRAKQTATNSEGTVTAYSAWSAAIVEGEAFEWADAADAFFVLDPAVVTESGGEISAIASTTANGGTATEWTSTGTPRPNIVTGPPPRMNFIPTNLERLTGDAAARSFFSNRSAFLVMLRISPDADSSSSRPIFHISTDGAAGSNLISLRHHSTNRIESFVRRLGSDSASSQATGPVTVPGQTYMVLVEVNYGSPSTHTLWVDGVAYEAGTVPSSGAASDADASTLAQIGSAATATASNFFDGKVGAIVGLVKNSSAFNPSIRANAQAKYDADHPTW